MSAASLPTKGKLERETREASAPLLPLLLWFPWAGAQDFYKKLFGEYGFLDHVGRAEGPIIWEKYVGPVRSLGSTGVARKKGDTAEKISEQQVKQMMKSISLFPLMWEA